MPTNSASSQASRRPIDLRRLGVGIVIAIVLNLVVYAIGASAGATWIANDQSVSWFLVIIATAAAMVIGGVITALLARWRRGAIRAMAWIGLAIGVVTVPAPILGAGDTATGIGLASMHVLTAVVWFFAIRPSVVDARD
jgi:hypothetical protein